MTNSYPVPEKPDIDRMDLTKLAALPREDVLAIRELALRVPEAVNVTVNDADQALAKDVVPETRSRFRQGDRVRVLREVARGTLHQLGVVAQVGDTVDVILDREAETTKEGDVVRTFTTVASFVDDASLELIAASKLSGWRDATQVPPPKEGTFLARLAWTEGHTVELVAASRGVEGEFSNVCPCPNCGQAVIAGTLVAWHPMPE